MMSAISIKIEVYIALIAVVAPSVMPIHKQKHALTILFETCIIYFSIGEVIVSTSDVAQAVQVRMSEGLMHVEKWTACSDVHLTAGTFQARVDSSTCHSWLFGVLSFYTAA